MNSTGCIESIEHNGIDATAALHRSSYTWLLLLALSLFAIDALAVSISEFPITDALGLAHGPAGIISGADGNLWFTDSSSDLIGKISTSGTPALFPLPGPPFLGIYDLGLAITSAADGNTWFTSINQAGQIGRITPDGNIALIPIAPDFGGAQSITNGPDGNVWFLSGAGNSVGRITPQGVVTQFSIPAIDPNPNIGSFAHGGITTGADGNLWFAGTGFSQCNDNRCQNITGYIGRITPTGAVTNFALPGASTSPYAVAKGADGNVWFTQNTLTYGTDGLQPSAGSIGEISPNGTISEFSLTNPNSGPYGITAGSDGNLWFTEIYANNIARITPAGVVTEFPIPTAGSGPVGIVTGADGNLWFTETYAGKIGRLIIVTPPGTIDGYMSGNWYDPTQSGQGFQLEMDKGNIMVATWYTFTPDGDGQTWVYAQGSYDNTKNTVSLPAVLVTGAKFPPNFLPGDVTKTPWGTLTFTFSDCNHGTARWNSTLPGYASGSMPITRLTQIQGTSCP
ncbi:MAG: hypothetical protein ABI304_09885 [Rudaea sp.]